MEQGGRTYANICGTDDEGFGLREGMRGGYSFTLNLGRGGVGNRQDGLLPTGRFIASSQSTENFGTSDFLFPYRWPNKVKGRHIDDDKWHHVAWQFRYKDQLNTLFLDGQLMAKISLHDPGSPGIIVNNTKNICVPFAVGGWIHSQDPPFYIKSGNFQGDIDALRISKVMRYPVARELAIVRQKLPKAGLKIPYSIKLTTDVADGSVAWKLLAGKLPRGLALDEKRGVIHGTPLEEVVDRRVTIQATDSAAATDEHTVSATVVHGRLVTKSLPPAFTGSVYQTVLKTTYLAKPARWEVVRGTLPKGIALDGATGQLHGTPAEECSARVAIQVTDANGVCDRTELVLRALPQKLRVIKADANTVVLYDWQGPNGKLIADVMGDKLIWQMQSPNGRKLVNDRKHAAQFSVSTRLTGDVHYGVNNFLGFGNFFGQIGEIRISNTRRY